MKIPAGEFKAKCLKLMDEVRLTQKEVVITKHGVPIAKLVPIVDDGWKPGSKTAFGWMKGTVKSEGDIISPIDVKWDACE